MHLNKIYIGIALIAQIVAILIGTYKQPDISVPIIAPMLMSITALMIIMLVIHSMSIRNYLYKNHNDIWQQITDYASLSGNGTYNVPTYYKFIYSDKGEQDATLQKRKMLIKLLFRLIPIIVVSIPLNIAYIFIVSQ